MIYLNHISLGCAQIHLLNPLDYSIFGVVLFKLLSCLVLVDLGAVPYPLYKYLNIYHIYHTCQLSIV